MSKILLIKKINFPEHLENYPKKHIYIISASLAAFFFILANVFLSISSAAVISLKFF